MSGHINFAGWLQVQKHRFLHLRSLKHAVKKAVSTGKWLKHIYVKLYAIPTKLSILRPHNMSDLSALSDFFHQFFFIIMFNFLILSDFLGISDFSWLVSIWVLILCVYPWYTVVYSIYVISKQVWGGHRKPDRSALPRSHVFRAGTFFVCGAGILMCVFA